MKKYLKLLFAVAFLTVIVACANDDDNNGEANNDGEDVTEVRVALITHSPDSVLDDGSFNQGAWDGIVRFLEANGLNADDHADSFIPNEASDASRIDTYEQAINAGFDVLVLPGHHHQHAVYEAQDMFPETTFIVVDAVPTNPDTNERRVEDNVAAILHTEHEAGFLAGYAAVREGYRDLGFMGGLPIPNIVRFGYGFIQGAEHAAQYLELEPGSVTINYTYLGAFAPDPAHTTAAAAWYASGVEVIFTAAGGAGGSVMTAAETANASVIGVDVDQHAQSSSVVTSALKRLDNTVYSTLTSYIEGDFNSGTTTFDATMDGVGLALENSRMENFTQEMLDVILEGLATGDIQMDETFDLDVLPETEIVVVTEL